MTIKEKGICIYLLPFAGGGASDMNPLRSKLEKYYNTNCIELPGRGRRWRESFIISIEEAVDDICLQIKDDNHIVIVGHSLGAYLGFMVACRLSLLSSVSYIALSNFAPLARNKLLDNISLLSSPTYIREIVGDRGVLDQLKSYGDEVYFLALNVLKNDLLLSDSFLRYKQKPKMIYDIHFIYGRDEEYTKEDISKWQLSTNSLLFVYSVQGGHFFPQEYPEQVASIICSILEAAEVY
ncbi:hypothetical protein LCGC14_0025260 [marine sediment metagenome]|uniref:Thioesterase domain-containing protein n=1 Tax=marine sediment metagenome TaxID=412755 RepID=A0A0F9YYX2_9ZZZZ|nr:alpha/beta fold hydrolase [Halomonas sp.]MCL5425288.1 alpha/beta fold hydrolase [Gammaproteobacteria bacterium]HDZ48063.1 alpha/beta fold hydrolase [Halomonas sp.]HEB04399.1 alpha/beta fold hydrolase [Halomonas sp.]|tara:strand:- start:1133 stop:1846 length:714 start_codon:yes stop_codon:yes gene_type:complete